MSPTRVAPRLDIDAVLDDRQTRVVVCCGAGGVGKTTTAAALAVRAAERGRSTVVLTIDPARRLAQALGMRMLGNEPQPVPGVAGSGAGNGGARNGSANNGSANNGSANNGSANNGRDAGELHAMMLDMRRTFDEMVYAHTTRERADKIIANPFYQTVASSFAGTQEYMAMEKLGQLAASGNWDLIVVDTPPSRSALDFLDAPQRMASFLDGRMIRLLSAPARAGGRGLRRLVGAGFGLFARTVSAILGGALLADASAFVQAFDTMFGGFRERSEATYALLRSPGTRFLVIAAPEPDALREAAYFVDRLAGEQMPLAGLVLNRTHPVLAELPAARARDAADTVESAGSPLAAAVLRLHADRVEVAERERRLLGRFTNAHPTVPVQSVPALAGDIADLAGLRTIGARLAATPPRPARAALAARRSRRA